MLILLHEVDPDVMLTFTAYNLGNLPPLTQNHVDISVIIQQLSSIKTEIACLKESAKLSSDIHSELKTEICSILILFKTLSAYCVAIFQQRINFRLVYSSTHFQIIQLKQLRRNTWHLKIILVF